MRNRRHVGNCGHFQAQRLNCSDGRFTSWSGSFYVQRHFLQPHRHGGFDRLLRSQPGSKGCALARSFEACRSCASPGNCISLTIGYSDDGVVESRIDVNLSGRQRSFRLFRSAFSACCAYTLSHSTSQIHQTWPQTGKFISYRPDGVQFQIAAGWKVTQSGTALCEPAWGDYFLAPPRRPPRPATVFFGPLRVRAFVRVRWPRTGKFRRWRMPR
jgi:hypothetical protein